MDWIPGSAVERPYASVSVSPTWRKGRRSMPGGGATFGPRPWRIRPEEGHQGDEQGSIDPRDLAAGTPARGLRAASPTALDRKRRK